MALFAPPGSDFSFFSFFLLVTTDKRGEDAAGQPPPTAAPVGRTGRISEAACQRVREGDQTERARGQRGEAGRYHLIGTPERPQIEKRLCSLISPAAQQTERQPGAAVPASGSDSSDPGGRDVPPAGGDRRHPRRTN